MTLPRSAADVLADHLLFEIEAIDPMYSNSTSLGCSTARGSPRFRWHRGHRFASSALMAR